MGSPSPPAGLSILVVDDCSDTAESLALVLEAWGHEVRMACNAWDAMEKVDAKPPDVVLLDIGLPLVDGWEFARRLRQRADGATFLLVAISGYAQEEDVRQSREAGCDCHFSKPVELADLERLLAVRKQQKG